jgi:hypothetical protein
MKQIWPNYSYSPATNVLTLTGLNIDRDQLLLVTAADRGRIMYNFADSSVTASAFTSGANTALTLVATTAGLTTTAALVIYFDDQATSSTVTGTVELGPTSLNALESITVTMGGTVTVGNSLTISSLPAISGTVTANVFGKSNDGSGDYFQIPIAPYDQDITSASFQYVVPVQISTLNGSVGSSTPLPISGTVTIGSAIPSGTNRIGVVTIGAGTVTIGAGTAQIGSVTASISGTVPISISSVTIGNSVTIGSLPAISGTVTANTFALQGTAVTTSNFTSTTASTVLANFNATREVLTIFNEGAGNLHICAGATCTTIAYQVRLSAGDYYEVPNHQTTITHSAVFATAGTARVMEVS